jgi:hypothetical protein
VLATLRKQKPLGCTEFTTESRWPLIEWLAGQIHLRLTQLRKNRAALVTQGPFLFHGCAPGLECIGQCSYPYPDDPSARPRAWVSVHFRLGKPVRSNVYGGSEWERELTIEARLPEAHKRKIVEGTKWWNAPGGTVAPTAEDEDVLVRPPRERKRARVSLWIGYLEAQLRAHERRRLEANEQMTGEWRRPLVPQRMWIDPSRTRLDVTKMELLWILVQEGLVKFDDDPDALKWATEWPGWTRLRVGSKSMDWRDLPGTLEKAVQATVKRERKPQATRRDRLKEVTRADDETPLKWMLAWEAVEQREREGKPDATKSDVPG